MTNRYSPPKAHVEDVSDQPVYTEQYKREKSAIRPFGVVAIVALFGLFSMLGAAFLALERDWWVIADVAITALLAYWFRKLWWGGNGERKTAVFVGFLASSIAFLGRNEDPVRTWPASEWVGVAEGCYFFLAACYLIHARKYPFFSGRKGPDRHA